MAPRSTKKRHGPQKSEGDEESGSDSASESSGSRDRKEDREDDNDDEQGGSTDDELSDEEGTDEEDDEEEEDHDGAKAVTKVGKQKRGSRRKRKNARDVDPSKGNIYSLKNEFRGKGIGILSSTACALSALSLSIPLLFLIPFRDTSVSVCRRLEHLRRLWTSKFRGIAVWLSQRIREVELQVSCHCIGASIYLIFAAEGNIPVCLLGI